MNAYTISSDICSAVKQRKDKICLSPHGQYIGIELSDDKFEKLYATYMALLVMQYNENNIGEESDNNG